MANIKDLKNQVVAQKSQTKSLQELINASINELGKALPSHLNAERLGRIALTTIRLNPKLTECTPESFLGALFQSAQLGLEPNIEGQAYILPFLNSKKIDNVWVKKMEAQFIIGYKGYIDLYYRSSNAGSLDMQEVYENDFFEFQYGTEGYIKHRPTLKDRGEVIGYYAIAKLKTGETLFKVMSKDECVEHGRTHSKSFDKDNKTFDKNSPWAKDLNAMCKKTVLIQLMKLLPKSIELQKAFAMDNTTKSVVRPDMFEVKDETTWSDEEIANLPLANVVESAVQK